MLGGGTVRHIYELKGQGMSERAIARQLEISRNTVKKYLASCGIPKQKPRSPQASRLDPFKDFVKERLAEGLTNCMVLLREIRAQGYSGGYTILKDFVRPLRPSVTSKLTVRFETEPGEQAQVDFGYFSYRTPDGFRRHLWAFVMVLSWSRAIYVEFILRADEATFLRCHLNAFERFGGVPKKILYDNAKVAVIARDENDEPVFNTRLLDFALRVGFDPLACRPYRARTKGRVESGVKYVRRNFWPSARFVDVDDLNRQVQVWCDTVANPRIHGTTCERPVDRLAVELAYLAPPPGRQKLAPFLREPRRVGSDAFIQWERSYYGVPWQWAGEEVQVQAGGDYLEIWFQDQRLAVHPKATRPGQRFTLPGQWSGMPKGGNRPQQEPLAVQVPFVEVQQRPLGVYNDIGDGQDYC